MDAGRLAILEEAWSRLQAVGSSWFWFAHGMKNGDLYHACALAAAFRARHGTARPIRLVVDWGGAFDIARLFGADIADVYHMGEFSISAGEWAAFRSAKRFAAFGPDVPIILHPLQNPETRALGGFVRENRLTWLTLYRHIVRLDGDAPPKAPPVDPGQAEAAAALCDAHGVDPGRSAIFFPYAQSFPVAAEAHFACLAERMRAGGTTVFTSVAGRETPVAGTTPIAIPFALLPDVVERAGWAVAVRSGICDIVAPTRARKTFLFRNGGDMPCWSAATMDLCRDATELPFDVVRGSPEAFAEAVMRNDAGLPPPPRPRISDEVGAADGVLRERLSLDFAALQRGDATLAGWTEQVARRRDGVPLALRLENVPTRDHPRWGDLAGEAATWLARLEDELELHACYDGAGRDAFEPLTAASLRLGRYGAASGWHSLLATTGASLSAWLPAAGRLRLLPATRMPAGCRVALADAWSGPEMAAFADALRPFDYQGLRLLDGWHEPEPWGVWSKGCRARLMISPEAPLAPGAVLRLDGDVAISPAFPALEVESRVNGRVVAQSRLGLGERVLDVPLPPDEDGAPLIVELGFAEVRSPAAQGSGPDNRPLGIGLHGAEIVAG